MRTELAGAFGKRFSLEIITAKPKPPPPRQFTANTYSGNPLPRPQAETFDEPSKNGGPTPDLALDVRTTKWGIVGTRWGHYAIDYAATLTLTDLRSGKVLAEGICDGAPLDDPKNPTLDELTQAGPEKLRAMVNDAGTFCYEDFRQRVLGLVN